MSQASPTELRPGDAHAILSALQVELDASGGTTVLTGSNATVSVTLYDLAGQAVSGASGLAATYLSAAAKWRARIPASAAVQVGETYKAVATATVTSGADAGLVGQFAEWVTIVEGDGA